MEISQWRIEIENLLNKFHDCAAKSRYEEYFHCFHSNGCFIGTDGTEYWNIEQFKLFCLPHFQKKSAWIYIPIHGKRNLFPYHATNQQDHQPVMVAFDELLQSRSLKCEVRGSGTIVWNNENNRWEILSYYLSIPIPDSVGNRVAKLIDDYHSTPHTEQIDMKQMEANAEAAAAALLAEIDLESKSSKKSSNKQQKKKSKSKR